MALIVAPALYGLEWAVGVEAVENLFAAYFGAEVEALVAETVEEAFAEQYAGLASYGTVRAAANAGFATDVALAVGGSAVAGAVSGTVLDPFITPGVRLESGTTWAPGKRKSSDALNPVKKRLDFDGSVARVTGKDSLKLESQFIINQINQIMDIPLKFRIKPVTLGGGHKPQKTPRSILDLFPAFYETYDKQNVLQAYTSLPGYQKYHEERVLTKTALDTLFEKSKWTFDQYSANVAGTNYATNPPIALASLGFPHVIPGDVGGATTVGSSATDVGMWYSHTNKVEYYNPTNVCAYLTIQVHTSKQKPNHSSVVSGPADAAQLGPLEFYISWDDEKGHNRFFVSTAQGPGADPGTLTSAPPATSTWYEADPGDLKVIGSLPKGKLFDRFFRTESTQKLVLPPGASATMWIRKPWCYYDAAGTNSAAASIENVANHTYWISNYHHGQLGYATNADNGQYHWGETSAAISMRMSHSYKCRFHARKHSEGMHLINSRSYILTTGQATVSTGDPNEPVAMTSDVPAPP